MLWQLGRLPFSVLDEVSVIKRLDTKIVELQVALWLDISA